VLTDIDTKGMKIRQPFKSAGAWQVVAKKTDDPKLVPLVADTFGNLRILRPIKPADLAKHRAAFDALNANPAQ